MRLCRFKDSSGRDVWINPDAVEAVLWERKGLSNVKMLNNDKFTYHVQGDPADVAGELANE